ncbi:MAG TPA: GNAT family N-acetyltransferase [Kiritimatiellia bacterium]|nr:GNAT family N-acetyltransferase [Kiritimatiellia bacterium]HRZ12416.1 GNAT family N-acetyltransferase [Kiritimatiellia bacterium]HSA17826.1 GNAT family N-acetyltransferase [Kiritimatiellia bacterium]
MNATLFQRISWLAGRALGSLPAAALLKIALPLRPVVRDVDPVRDLDALALFGAALRPALRPRLRAAWEQALRDAAPDFRRVLVAADARRPDRLAGFLHLQKGRPDWWIAGMEVRPLYRRRGLAELMAREAIRRLKAEGARTICLSVRAGNASAIRLYEKLGFRPAEGLSDPTLHPGDVGMRLILQPGAATG